MWATIYQRKFLRVFFPIKFVSSNLDIEVKSYGQFTLAYRIDHRRTDSGFICFLGAFWSFTTLLNLYKYPIQLRTCIIFLSFLLYIYMMIMHVAWYIYVCGDGVCWLIHACDDYVCWMRYMGWRKTWEFNEFTNA